MYVDRCIGEHYSEAQRVLTFWIHNIFNVLKKMIILPVNEKKNNYYFINIVIEMYKNEGFIRMHIFDQIKFFN